VTRDAEASNRTSAVDAADGALAAGGLVASSGALRGVIWTLVLGLGLTTAVALLVVREQRSDLQAELDALAVELAAHLETRVSLIDQTLLTLAAEVRVGGPDVDQFTAVVTNGQLVENTRGLENLSLAVEYPTPGPDRPAQGGTSLIVERIVPIVLETGLDGELDLYDRGEERRRATTAARDTGQTAATAPLELAYPGAGILYYAPIYESDASTVEARRARFIGTTIAVINADELFEDFVGRDPLVHIEVADVGPRAAMGASATSVWALGEDATSATRSARAELPVADRLWRLTVAPTDLLSPPGTAVIATGLGGVLFTLSLAALAASILSARARAERLVEQRTVELARRTDELTTAYKLQSNFITTVTHELRTPLTAVLGFIETVRARGGQEGVDTIELLTRAERQGRHLDRMIQQLLDFGDIERGQLDLHLEQVDLRDLIPALVDGLDPVLNGRQVTIEIDAPTGARVFADRDAIAQVLGNLLENAVRYAPGDTPIEVGVTNHPDAVTITIADHGLGIDPSDAPFVFERFYRGVERMGKGTGIGLAVVRALVDAHDGHIDIAETAGGGATFAITLPRIDDAGS